MKSLRRALFATSFAASLTLAFSEPVLAEAPVVDESENFALFEQQAASGQPASRGTRLAQLDEEAPLAHEEYTNTNSTGNNAALLNKIQGLQQDIQELRGQLEMQSHEVKALQQQQVEFYKDLDARLRHEPIATQQTKPVTTNPQNDTSMPLNLDEPMIQGAKPETSASIEPAEPLPTPISTATNRRANPADEQMSYLAAYELINNKQFTEALPAMQAFVTKYPEGGYTANAHYWIGELYMVQKNYPEAVQQFELVLQKFPSSSKTSASMLKLGYALAAAGELNSAKQKLQTVIKQYPDTHAAQLALAKLESLGNR